MTSALVACADKGRWQHCVPIVAAFVGGDTAAEAGAYPEMLARLSARDRALYAFDVAWYEAHLTPEGCV